MSQPKKTVDDVANFFQLPKSWVYAQTRRKGPDTIPLIRCGKYIRFDLDEVEKWLREQNRKEF